MTWPILQRCQAKTDCVCIITIVNYIQKNVVDGTYRDTVKTKSNTIPLECVTKFALCRPYILPEVYSAPFTEAAEDEQIRPKAILFIKMIGAKHVPKMDIISQSDPYVR